MTNYFKQLTKKKKQLKCKAFAFLFYFIVLQSGCSMSKPIFAYLREEEQWLGGTKKIHIDGASIMMSFDDWTFRVEHVGADTCGCEINWPKDALYNRYAILICTNPESISLSLYKQDAQSRQVVGSWKFKMRLVD
jgi:hypothetical protein